MSSLIIRLPSGWPKIDVGLLMKCITRLVLALYLCHNPSVAQETLTIYTEEWAPISFTLNGKPSGLAVEVVQAIQQRINNQSQIHVITWARGWKIITEQPNTMLFTMTRTSERERMFSLVGPVAVGTTNCYALKDSELKINSIEDAKQAKSIGVYRASVEEQLLLEHGFNNIAPASTPLMSAKQLLKKRIDLWCNANLTAPTILTAAGASINDVKSLFTFRENQLYIAFSQGTPSAEIDKWKDALISLKADGSFTRIYRRWLPEDTPPLHTERIGL
jgi:polar amino acid transport system substrate-binding protein